MGLGVGVVGLGREFVTVVVSYNEFTAVWYEGPIIVTV